MLFASNFGEAGGVVLASYPVNGLLEPSGMGGFGVVKLPHQSGLPSSLVNNFLFAPQQPHAKIAELALIALCSAEKTP